MRPTWLIEAGVYGDEATRLLSEVRRHGMACEIVPHQSLKKGQSQGECIKHAHFNEAWIRTQD